MPMRKGDARGDIERHELAQQESAAKVGRDAAGSEEARELGHRPSASQTPGSLTAAAITLP